MDEVTNKCGSCSACCTLLGVSELNKKSNTRCEHQCGEGCNIYPERPPSCAAFQCLWLTGHFGDEDFLRPDHFGIMFQIMVGTKFLPPGEPLLCAYEVWPGASRSEIVQPLLSQLASTRLVLILSLNNRSFIGPPDEVSRVRRLIKEAVSQHRGLLGLPMRETS